MINLLEGRDRWSAAIWAVCGLLVVVLGVRWLTSADRAGQDPVLGGRSGQQASGSQDARNTVGAAPASIPAGGPVIVDVNGRVRHPGVYSLPAGSRVFQALKRAGGSMPDANIAAINLAARVVDGSQISVGRRGSLPSGAGSAASSQGGPISLSTATPEQLDRLDGIGPSLAERIVAWRESHGGFRSLDDLDQVSGIGPAKLEALRSQVIP